VEETFKLPGEKPIKQDLIQPISRLADAYVENLGDSGMVWSPWDLCDSQSDLA
jgi:hypothetical protein